MVLTLSDTIRFREEDFGGILFRKEDNFFIQLNKEGYKLIKSFQDPSNIEYAQKRYSKFVNIAKGLRILVNKEDNLESKIRYDRTSNLIKPNTQRIYEGFLRSPLEVGIEITSVCQLKCIHCYGAFTNKSSDKELSTEEIYNIIDQLDDLGTFAIFVGEGEPTLHPDFFDICKYILSKDMNVVVSTNGVGIDEYVANQFSRLGSYIGIQVSLEGPNPKVNDLIRGDGSFEYALRGLKNLQNSGLTPTIGTTITNLNYSNIEEMILFAIKMNVPHIHFMNLMPSGRGDKLYERLKLTRKQREWLAIEFKNLKEKYKRYIGIDYANFYQQPPSKDFDPETFYDFVDKIYAGCDAARIKAVITSEGDVIGCEILRNYVGGNIREKTFIDIWENSNVFKKIRSRNANTIEGKCTSYKYVKECVGDCPSYSIH